MSAELDQLLDELEGQNVVQSPTRESGDAIDVMKSAPSRKSNVRSLRNDETVKRFRRELADGHVRVDTANQLLGLIRIVVSALWKP